MTHDEFVSMVVECMENRSASQLLAIPGVWEAVSEEFNNEAIERWEAKQARED